MTRGFLIKIPTNRIEFFEDYISDKREFGEPVGKFSYNRNYPFLLLISAKKDHLTHLGRGKGGITAASEMRRMNISKVHAIEHPISFSAIVKISSSRMKNHLKNALEKDGIIAPESLTELITCVTSIVPYLIDILPSYFIQNRSLRSISSKAIQALSDQKEAISTALQISDIDRAPLQTWNVQNGETPRNFLDGIDSAYLREDQMLNYDMGKVPGFSLIRQYSYSRAQFRSDTESVVLDIILANRTLLEEQIGADLIYYNEIYHSFVFVQYKAMEKNGGSSPSFRLPNEQLSKEIEAMETLLAAITPPYSSHRHHYRFTYNPFFIKLCPRVVFNPDDVKLTPGMYFNLDHWKFLETDPELTGRRGGRVITYDNIERHLNNTDFATLVKHSWIGTTPYQSKTIEALIKEVLKTGKSLIYAIKRNPLNQYPSHVTVFEDGDVPF